MLVRRKWGEGAWVSAGVGCDKWVMRTGFSVG